MRYEPPSPFSRWDTPLFTVPTSDAHPPYDAIWTALFPEPSKQTSKKAIPQRQQDTKPADQVKQHAATILPTATSAEALQILESTTQLVISSLLSSHRSQGLDSDGGTLKLSIPITSTDTGRPETVEEDLTIPPGTVVSQPMLQRLRRKYTQMQRGGIAHGVGYVQGRRAVVEGFVRFLRAEIGGE